MLGGDSPNVIPRCWEVDWAVPRSEGGTPWAALGWLLDHAAKSAADTAWISVHTFDALRDLDFALGRHLSRGLRGRQHTAALDGLSIRVFSDRERDMWAGREPLLLVYPTDEDLAWAERANPSAIAAVAAWPDRVAGWVAQYAPERVGQVRAEKERRHGGE